jgi:hypothetical protein
MFTLRFTFAELLAYATGKPSGSRPEAACVTPASAPRKPSLTTTGGASRGHAQPSGQNVSRTCV